MMISNHQATLDSNSNWHVKQGHSSVLFGLRSGNGHAGVPYTECWYHPLNHVFNLSRVSTQPL